MSLVSFDYGISFFDNRLKEFAKAYLRHLPGDVTVLLCTGSSGCSIASAMIVLSKNPLRSIYVRKEGEKSHRDGSVGNCDMRPNDVVFIVDDFIEKGYTVARLLEWADKRKFKVTGILVNHCNSEEFWIDMDAKFQAYKVGLL